MIKTSDTLHATAVILGDTGILIRGKAGSGKSTLARRLLTWGARYGRFARLVSDDRVKVSAVHQRLIAETIPSIAGLLEIRGVGINKVPYEEAAVIGLVVDVDIVLGRFPETCDKSVAILDVTLPRMAIQGMEDSAEMIAHLAVRSGALGAEFYLPSSV